MSKWKQVGLALVTMMAVSPAFAQVRSTVRADSLPNPPQCGGCAIKYTGATTTAVVSGTLPTEGWSFSPAGGLSVVMTRNGSSTYINVPYTRMIKQPNSGFQIALTTAELAAYGAPASWTGPAPTAVLRFNATQVGANGVTVLAPVQLPLAVSVQ